MDRAHIHLWCIGLFVASCGDDVSSGNESSGSSDTSTSGPNDTTDTSTDTTDGSDDTTTDTTDSADEDTSTSPVCGDGIVEADEVCDAAELADETCTSQGFDSGTLACASDCMGFDTSSCGSCGNGMIDGSEACDGSDLGSETCESQGRLSGTLACTPDCQFDLGACNLPSEARLLLTQGEELQERELDGTLVNTTVVPLEGGTEEELRELTHWDGVTYLYRGTFSPTMTYYDDDLADWVHEPFAGWSTVNNVSYGGLAHTEDWGWATDMITSGKPEIGLVRFSLLGLPTERVMDGEEYIDVFAGLDGLVYGLQSNGDTVDVIDPGTGLPIDVIALAAPARAIAVAEDGTIFGAAFDGNIYMLDATGGLLMSLAAGIESLVDVDLASDGTIAASSSLGNVVVVEPGLGAITWSFDAGPDETFLEFLDP
jgi:hypothetical protein